MSAALALDPVALPERSVSTPRPRLRLVPTGPNVDAVRHSVRLSRRGRLARTGAIAALSLAVGWTVASTVAAGAVPPLHTVTVESGQTLSSIAARELPGLSLRDGVAQLQLANGLSSSDVHVGQVLQIPARG